MRPHPEAIIRILNPADYFTLAIDEEIRKEGMPGSVCGFALELKGRPDSNQLGDRIDDFCRNFPVSRGKLQKIGRRYFWCKRQQPEKVFFLHECSDRQDVIDEFHSTILRVINRMEPRETVHPIEFHLFPGTAKSILLVRWIHPFCDAVGVELVLKYLAADPPPVENECNKPQVSLVNQKISRFTLWRKFGLILKTKNWIEQIDQFQSILPAGQSSPPQRLNFKVFRLDLAQSRKITETSRQQVGLTGTSLYYIGCLMRAIDRMKTRSTGEAYCVPYAFNLRKQKALTPVTGNHVGALFAQAPVETVQDRARLFKHLTSQYRRTIRDELDYAFLPLMWAAQWMSLERVGKTLRQSYRNGKERSSFWFSDAGQSDLAGRDLCGAPVRGVFHLAQVTTPPGLALLTCVFENRLTLSYNFVEPLYDLDWILGLHQQVLPELLGER